MKRSGRPEPAGPATTPHASSGWSWRAWATIWSTRAWVMVSMSVRISRRAAPYRGVVRSGPHAEPGRSADLLELRFAALGDLGVACLEHPPADGQGRGPAGHHVQADAGVGVVGDEARDEEQEDDRDPAALRS